MAKLYFNTRDELNCVETDMIAVVQANGNYSRVVYITKKEVALTTGISKLEEALKSYNGKKNRFIRLGRSFIINHAYLTRVDVLKQILVISDNDKKGMSHETSIFSKIPHADEQVRKCMEWNNKTII